MPSEPELGDSVASVGLLGSEHQQSHIDDGALRSDDGSGDRDARVQRAQLLWRDGRTRKRARTGRWSEPTDGSTWLSMTLMRWSTTM